MYSSEEKIITDDRIMISGEKTDSLENLGLSKYEMSKKKSLLTLMIITIAYASHIHIDNALIINKYNKSNPSSLFNPITFLFLQISVVVLILLTKRVLTYGRILAYSYSLLTLTVIAIPVAKTYISKDYSNYVINSIMMLQGVISVIIECHLFMIVNNFTKDLVIIMTLGEPLYGLSKWGFNFLKICNFSKPKNKAIANFADTNFIIGLFFSLLSLSLLRLMYKNEYYIKRLIQIGEIKQETNTNINKNNDDKDKDQLNNSKDFSASDNSTNVSSKRSSKESITSDDESDFLILKYVNEIEDNMLYESNDNSTISLKNDLDNLFTPHSNSKKHQSKENKNNNNDDIAKGLNNNKSNNHFMKCSLNFAKDNEEDVIIHIDNSNEALNKFSLSIAPLFIKSLNLNICLALNNLITYSIFPYFLIGNYSNIKFTYSIFSMLFYLFDTIGRRTALKVINEKGKLILLTYLRLFLMFLIIIFRLHITNNICTILIIFLFGFLHGMGNASSVIISQNEISNSYLKEKSAANICLFQLIGLLTGITLNKTFISSFRKLLI